MLAAQSSPPALVLHLAHLAAPVRIARRYQAAYAGLGLDTLSVLPPPLLLWFPRLALRLAVEALEALAVDFAAGGPRPVLIAAFSGAPKVSAAAPRRRATPQRHAAAPRRRRGLTESAPPRPACTSCCTC